MNEAPSRPIVLRAADAPKAWGWELWLTSTRPPAEARVASSPETLADVVARHPEVLGPHTQALFGHETPIFAKLIHTHFPDRVHMGFRRSVAPDELIDWLHREQEALRQLFGALRITDQAGFQVYEARYAAWASNQALGMWRRDDDATTAEAFAPFVDSAFALRPWLAATRSNRATIVDALNDVDLRAEDGNLFLMGAGTVHAIFGLSHQTHPRDKSRAALEALFGELRGRHTASDAELAHAIEAAGLSELRLLNHAPPKNEAWLPTTADGESVLAEPQQTSDTTYSLADFYTPLVWQGGKVCFRKGAPTTGVSREQLAEYLADVEFGVTPVASMRRRPTAVDGAAGAELFRLVDEPESWPFFTAYQLELTGTWSASPPRGVFQELVVTRGRVELRDAFGPLGELSTRSPAFIPATAAVPYTLVAHEPATVLIFSVPGARGGAPLGRAG